MIHILEEDIKSRLWEIYIENNGEPIRKSGFKDYVGVPSYNTCMRRGITLNEINSEFSKKYYEMHSSNSCKECGCALFFNKRDNIFCNSSCAASFNLRERYKDLPEKLHIDCLWCGASIPQNFSKNRKYCNTNCQQLFLSCDRFLDWYVKGITHGLGVVRLKSFVEIKDGYKCKHCGVTEWNNKNSGLNLNTLMVTVTIILLKICAYYARTVILKLLHIRPRIKEMVDFLGESGIIKGNLTSR